MMKKLTLLLSLLFLLNGYLISQTSIPAGSVNGTWDISGSPFLIEGAITIPDGQTLTIEPGVLVEFQGYYKLYVEGTLLAVGSPADTIIFTISDTTGFSNQATTLGGWHGISFNSISSQNDSSRIVFCKLQYGKATGTEWQDRNGGAIFINWAPRIQISNCLFTNNQAIGSEPSGYAGGGAICGYTSNLKVENCTFYQNYVSGPSGAGGAIYYGADTTYFGVPYQVILKNNIFKNNYAITKGGVYVSNWGNNFDVIEVLIDGCDFLYNEAKNYSGLGIRRCDFTMSNCKFIGNQAFQYAGAGGFTGNSTGTLSNCLFDSNVADIGDGGWNSGGLSVWSFSDVDIMNCTFVNNVAAYGGGVTVAYGATASLTNSILRDNFNNQIALSSYNDFGGTMRINHCNIQYGQDSINVTDELSTLNWGVENMDEDPLFADPFNADYHLQATSPCISAAINAIEIAGVWQYSPSEDIEGSPRPNPVGSMPDMGAYESPVGIVVGINSSFTENSQNSPTLYENFPNPFSSSTTISFELSSESEVSIVLYDMFGRTTQKVSNKSYAAGFHELQIDGNNLSSGLYFYSLSVNNNLVDTKKMQVMK